MRRDCGTDAGARRTVAVPVPPTMSEAKVWQETAVQDAPAGSQRGEQEMPVSPATSVMVHAAPAEEAAPLPEPVADDATISPDVAETSPQPAPADRVTRGEKRQAADDDEVRDSFTHKIPPNKYVSGPTGVPETSNQFDILGLLSDDDSLPRDLQIDMDV